MIVSTLIYWLTIGRPRKIDYGQPVRNFHNFESKVWLRSRKLFQCDCNQFDREMFSH